MRIWIVSGIASGVVSAAMLCAPALAQEQPAPSPAQAAAPQTAPAPQSEPKDTVTIIAELRSDAVKKQQAAAQEAAEARKLFASARQSPGDLQAACLKASQADQDYGTAILATDKVAKAEASPAKEMTEDRIKQMNETRSKLDDAHSKLCRAGGMQPRGGLGPRGPLGPGGGLGGRGGGLGGRRP